MSSEVNQQYTSEGFHFPAPVLRINIYNVSTGKDRFEEFLIDSGSDITLIKKDIFSGLELIKIDEIEFEVADTNENEDESKVRDLTELGINIPGVNLKGTMQVAVGKRGETNLLGRDFLNKFHVTLDRGQDFTIRR